MKANETTEAIRVAKKNSPLEVSSRIISGIFTPFMIPFVAFFLLFFFTYLRIMPIQYKLIVLGIVYCFTILMPMLAIYLFQKINGWGIHELGHREKRFVPYALTIISYVTCLITMYKIHLPRYMSGIIVAALICMILCTLINFKWKISTHVASSGKIDAIASFRQDSSKRELHTRVDIQPSQVILNDTTCNIHPATLRRSTFTSSIPCPISRASR